ncbi:autophagy-related protein 9A-like isoform X1 [Dendronephthya gigantea]|uniref:autophagy-related protein 9A-like isoform X1 n=1 Tax=Dendronephthya gigantea TaxID=151771 RepID=UPI00106D6BA4|nr:autophagy-related protein 9A-like isoform X1 [Dendronephthya gigantea]
MIKRSPGTFGARHWSYYGRLFLRHFNELDHEFQIRLNKAYEPANQYTNIFTSPFLAIISKNIAFVAGSFFAVLTCLSIYDQDVFRAEHMLTTIASLGLLIRICYAFIPDENLIWCPEQLLRQVLVHIHYIPDEWKTKAHTNEVFQEFQQLFEYKAVFVIQELVSALVTPFLLCFSIRYKALDIVDFFRNFTVEVVGVGDVCSFAQMDVRKHGNPEWMSHGLTAASQYEQAENGKTELSLLQFSIKNPQWKPPQSQIQFMSTIKENAAKDSYPSLQTSLSGRNNESMQTSRIQSTGLPSLAPVASLPHVSQSFMSTSHGSVDHTGVQERLRLEEEMNSSMLYMHQLHDRGDNSESSQQATAASVVIQTTNQSSFGEGSTSEENQPSSPQDHQV